MHLTVRLLCRWFPLCSGARALSQQGRVELLAWLELSTPGLPLGQRDAVLHGYGVDVLSDGFMMVIGRSAAQSDFPSTPFPPVRGFGAARMHIAGLQVLVQPLAERRVRCCYCVNIDPRMPVPRPLLRLATQHVVGRIFHALTAEVRRMRAAPAASPHAARIARDKHVYSEWMLPRVEAALDLLAGRVLNERLQHSANQGSAAYDAAHDATQPAQPTTDQQPCRAQTPLRKRPSE